MFQTTKSASTALAILTLVLGLTLTGCAGADSSDVASVDDDSSPSSTTEPDAGTTEGDGIKFAECMREHGIDLPDPKDEGGGAVQFSLPRDTDDAAMGKAMDACRQFLPNGGEPMKLDSEQLEQAREFAECMRENGIEDFPDPSSDGGILIGGDTIEIDEEFEAAQEACSEFLPGRGEMIG